MARASGSRDTALGDANPSTSSSISSSKRPSFGQLLKRYRIDLGLSQRRLAEILGVDGSMIARIESGDREPPKRPEFYARLRDVPGLAEAEVTALMAAEGAPAEAWRDLVDSGANAAADRSVPRARLGVASHEGIRVALHLEADANELDEDEIDGLRQVMTAEMELFLRQFLRSRQERLERLGKVSTVDQGGS